MATSRQRQTPQFDRQSLGRYGQQYYGSTPSGLAAFKQGIDPRMGLGTLASMAAIPQDIYEWARDIPAPNRQKQVAHGVARALGQDVVDYEGDETASNSEMLGGLINPANFVNYVKVAKGAGKLGAEAIARAAQSESPLMRLATVGAQPYYVVKNKGGNWLAGSVEDALRPLKPTISKHARDRDEIDIANSLTRNPLTVSNTALNTWIDKKLTNYVKNQMATPEDPVRALAEQGILHYAPEAMPRGMDEVWSKRKLSGFPASVGTAPSARRWEAMADDVVTSRPMSDYQNFGPSNLSEEWVNRLPPDTPMYLPESRFSEAMSRGTESNLGFDHLTDELSNALNAESGLPAHLQLKPEDLGKMGIDQAVRQVAKINDWRAAQIAAAGKAALEGAPIYKTYENAPKGLHWRDMNVPDNPEATRKLHKSVGDQMGICVGGEGYCDRAIKGEAKHYSLFDEAGEPHVTIETRPREMLMSGNEVDRVIPGSWKEFLAHLDAKGPNAWSEYAAGTENVGGEKPLHDFIKAKYPDKYEQLVNTPHIVQIKGKANKAPNEEYLPFVQDFVKSGQWSDVGDLKNAGLVHRSTLDGAEIAKARPGQQYFTDAEIDSLYDDVRKRIADGEKFAQGGSVTTPNEIKTVGDLQRLLASLR